MKAKKIIAIGLVATMTLGMSTSVLATTGFDNYDNEPGFENWDSEFGPYDNAYNAKGQGWLEGGTGINESYANVIVPTTPAVDLKRGEPGLFDFGFDPQRLVKRTDAAKYAGKNAFTEDALNKGVYFVNPPEEGEELNMEVTDEWIKWKNEGGTRRDYLERIAKIEGVYVPSFYDVSYNDDKTINRIIPNNENANDVLSKRIIKNLDTVSYPDKWIVPYLSVVHDRPMLEIFRGCIRGCRFCQAGFLYRPVREKSVDVLESHARELIKNTGYEELALSSLSTV